MLADTLAADVATRLPARLATFDAEGWLANLRLLLDADPSLNAVDLRANAYGHGLARCRELLAEFAADTGHTLRVVASEGRQAAADELASAHRQAGSRIMGPASFGLAEGAGTRPVLRLEAAVMLVKPARAGEAVSYGRSYEIHGDTSLATVAIGYADGAVRRASNRVSVQVNGARCPIAGAISMDQLVLDLSDTEAKPGDRAILYGAGSDGEPTALEWSACTGIPPEAITTRLGRRVSRQEGAL